MVVLVAALGHEKVNSDPDVIGGHDVVAVPHGYCSSSFQSHLQVISD